MDSSTLLRAPAPTGLPFEAAEGSRLLACLLAIARWRYAILAFFGAYWCYGNLGVRGGDWHYFVLGSKLIFGRHAAGAPSGGLHLYAHYPELQIGPLSFVVARLIRFFGSGDGQVTAQLLMAVVGVLLLLLVER